MKRLCFILLLGVLLASCRAEASNPIPTTPAARLTPSPSPKTPSPAEIPRIQTQELWERLQAGETIVVVDVRSSKEYEQEHIAGAVSLPLDELSRRAAELPRDRLIVFYCT
ncbi:MAG: rhodanese-like domain-containing protein [Bryobacteraceae bacterium]